MLAPSLQEASLTYEDFCICVQRLVIERAPATPRSGTPRLRYLGNAPEVVWIDEHRRNKLLGFLVLERPALVEATGSSPPRHSAAAPPHPQLCAFRHCSLNKSLELKPTRAPAVRPAGISLSARNTHRHHRIGNFSMSLPYKSTLPTVVLRRNSPPDI